MLRAPTGISRAVCGHHALPHCLVHQLCRQQEHFQALTSGPCVYAGLGSSTAPGAGVSAVVHTLMQPSSAQLIRCPCSIAASAQWVLTGGIPRPGAGEAGHDEPHCAGGMPASDACCALSEPPCSAPQVQLVSGQANPAGGVLRLMTSLRGHSFGGQPPKQACPRLRCCERSQGSVRRRPGSCPRPARRLGAEAGFRGMLLELRSEVRFEQ